MFLLPMVTLGFSEPDKVLLWAAGAKILLLLCALFDAWLVAKVNSAHKRGKRNEKEIEVLKNANKEKGNSETESSEGDSKE